MSSPAFEAAAGPTGIHRLYRQNPRRNTERFDTVKQGFRRRRRFSAAENFALRRANFRGVKAGG